MLEQILTISIQFSEFHDKTSPSPLPALLAYKVITDQKLALKVMSFHLRTILPFALLAFILYSILIINEKLDVLC